MSGVFFLKMNGLGNDFIIFPDEDLLPPDFASHIPFLSHRAPLSSKSAGIGCDQFIVLKPLQNSPADVRMRIFNPDGGEVEACGNATRCVAFYWFQKTGTREVKIETLAGVLTATQSGVLTATHSGVLHSTVSSVPEATLAVVPVATLSQNVTVDMGVPKFHPSEIPVLQNPPLDFSMLDSRLTRGLVVNLGNPHVVFFIENVDTIPLERVGARIETDPLFPQKVNVTFAEKISENTFRARVWERAAGATLACGTAACAVAALAVREGLASKDVHVHLPGGLLRIGVTERLSMTGAAEAEFSGTYDFDRRTVVKDPEFHWFQDESLSHE